MRLIQRLQGADLINRLKRGRDAIDPSRPKPAMWKLFDWLDSALMGFKAIVRTISLCANVRNAYEEAKSTLEEMGPSAELDKVAELTQTMEEAEFYLKWNCREGLE